MTPLAWTTNPAAPLGNRRPLSVPSRPRGSVGSRTLDGMFTPLGSRLARFDANEGFFLDGRTLTAAMESTGAPATISLRPDRPAVAADGRDILHVTIELLDTEGRLITDGDKEVTVSTEVPLRLLALESGNLSDATPPKSNVRSTLHGRALAIFQTGSRGGTATVRATAAGLPDAVVSVEVRA